MRPSRRVALTGGLAALLGGRALAGAPSDATAVPAESDAAARMTVEVRIDGKGPFRFLVDTGADRSVVADDVAATLGVPERTPLIVEGIAATITAPAVRLTNLTFGPVALEHLRAPVLPRAALGADGYLGLDAIDGHRVALDFVKHELRIEAAHSRWGGDFAGFDTARVPVSGRGGKLVSTGCDIDGALCSAFVDTGAEITVGNLLLFEKLKADTGNDYLPGASVVMTGVTGGRVLGQLVNVGRVKLGSVEFDGCTLAICDLPIFDVWGIADRPALLIGMNFLTRTQSMSIDYRRQEILFRVADARVASAA